MKVLSITHSLTLSTLICGVVWEDCVVFALPRSPSLSPVFKDVDICAYMLIDYVIYHG